jgi:hypothetical protein
MPTKSRKIKISCFGEMNVPSSELAASPEAGTLRGILFLFKNLKPFSTVIFLSTFFSLKKTTARYARCRPQLVTVGTVRKTL